MPYIYRVKLILVKLILLY